MTQTTALTFGERLQAMRLKKKLTLDSLAVIAGTSRQHLIRLEKNLHVPKPEMVSRIADALGTTVDELQPECDDDEESDPVASLTDALNAIVAAAVAKALSRVPA